MSIKPSAEEKLVEKRITEVLAQLDDLSLQQTKLLQELSILRTTSQNHRILYDIKVRRVLSESQEIARRAESETAKHRFTAVPSHPTPTPKTRSSRRNPEVAPQVSQRKQVTGVHPITGKIRKKFVPKVVEPTPSQKEYNCGDIVRITNDHNGLYGAVGTIVKVAYNQVFIRTERSQNIVRRKYTNVQLLHKHQDSESEEEEEDNISESNTTQSGVDNEWKWE